MSSSGSSSFCLYLDKLRNSGACWGHCCEGLASCWEKRLLRNDLFSLGACRWCGLGTSSQIVSILFWFFTQGRYMCFSSGQPEPGNADFGEFQWKRGYILLKPLLCSESRLGCLYVPWCHWARSWLGHVWCSQTRQESRAAILKRVSPGNAWFILFQRG